MATGTGKTYVAFQVIYRLWKSGKKKRILYLADRNNLILQTKKGDFKHFKDKLHIIKHKEIDKSYEIYLALYQGLTNYDSEDAYRQFSANFFDLIIVDECHRGSVDEDKAWHRILSYFSSATQIGMTATPKETETLSNIEYFGDPIYTYSLKQGIDDGFLAPYKVLKVGINVDLEGYVPEKGKRDDNGELIEERLYNTKDFDRNLVIDERTKVVAHKIVEFLANSNPYDKTIVFCIDIEHAERMRRAILERASKEMPDVLSQTDKYVVRITGDDPAAKGYLEDFINPEERFPCIATTSKLLTTGTDAQTCKVIALDCNIGSMTEFKQIIGRGTRINEEYEKYYFTIIDFRNVTNKFFEKDFDGTPVRIKEVKDSDRISEDIIDDNAGNDADGLSTDSVIGDEDYFDENSENGCECDDDRLIREANGLYNIKRDKQEKVYISGVDVSVLSERRQFVDEDGSLVICSLKEWTRLKVSSHFRSLDDFLLMWNSADRKKAVIDELEAQGLVLEELRSEVKSDLDVFDLVCYIAWDAPALTRRERAEKVKKRNYWAKYGEKARVVLERLLDKYAENGIEDIEDMKVLTVDPLSTLGTVSEIVSAFGNKSDYLKAIRELEDEIYSAANIA